jgi:hypothetical protein
LEIRDKDRAMKKSLLAVAIAIAFAGTTPALAQITSNAGGGAGGAGGSAAGGTAQGGTATNSNNTSGVSNASGGIGQGGTGGVASGGTSSSQAAGGYVGTVSTGGSTASVGDVSVNFNSGNAPMGKAGLGVGVDPTTGHIVTENSISYSGAYKVKNTPDVSVGGPASGPCNGFSGGIGVSMAGIGIGANASTVDEGCSARETARVAAMIGRMDVANAVLENLPIVQAAMKAKATRDALSLPAPKAEVGTTTAPAQLSPPPTPVQTQEQREAALKEQQRLAQEALQRQATMAKINDTLTFTDASTQLREKTPQQVMAEEATKKLAANAGEGNNKPQNYAAIAPSAPTNKSDAQVAAAPTVPSLATKSDATPKAADNKMSAQSALNLPTNQAQPLKIELVSKVDDRRTSAAPTAEERIKAAKAALNLQ